MTVLGVFIAIIFRYSHRAMLDAYSFRSTSFLFHVLLRNQDREKREATCRNDQRTGSFIKNDHTSSSAANNRKFC